MKPKYQQALELLALEWVELWLARPVDCQVVLRVK